MRGRKLGAQGIKPHATPDRALDAALCCARWTNADAMQVVTCVRVGCRWYLVVHVVGWLLAVAPCSLVLGARLGGFLELVHSV